jgi:hypothetical protein
VAVGGTSVAVGGIGVPVQIPGRVCRVCVRSAGFVAGIFVDGGNGFREEYGLTKIFKKTTARPNTPTTTSDARMSQNDSFFIVLFPRNPTKALLHFNGVSGLVNRREG